MTEVQAKGTDDVTESTDLEPATNDDAAASEGFAADLEEVIGGQEEGIVAYW